MEKPAQRLPTQNVRDLALADFNRDGYMDLVFASAIAAADAAMDVLEHTIRGRLTAAEALRHNEFVLTKLYESA